MKIKFLLTILFASILFACQNQSDNNSSVSIRLTDAPGDYKEVWIDIQSVEVNLTTDSINGEWTTLQDFHAGLYNLLDYANGNDTLLGSAVIGGAGTISQIRLILGDQNSVVTDEGTYSLKVPSGSTSGLKINLHETLEEGIMTNIWIDFNASKSIVKKGNGSYSLKPVIRAYTEVTKGGIKGIVAPKEALPNVYVVVGQDTLGTIADTTGYFFIGGVPGGSYSVKFEPVDPFLDLSIDGVQVVDGVYTNLDTVHISQ